MMEKMKFLQYNQRLYFAERCNDLPDIWNLKTDMELPVNHGTRVEVSCIDGYNLSGSSLITCVKNKNWSFDDKPLCVLSEIFLITSYHI